MKLLFVFGLVFGALDATAETCYMTGYDEEPWCVPGPSEEAQSSRELTRQSGQCLANGGEEYIQTSMFTGGCCRYTRRERNFICAICRKNATCGPPPVRLYE